MNGHLVICALTLAMSLSILPTCNTNTNSQYAQQEDNSNAKYARQEEFVYAAYDGDVGKMNTLLAEGVDVNAPSGFQSHLTLPPLTLAAGKGHIDAVQLLLEKGANVNIKGREDYTPLMAAAAGGHTDIVRLLIEKGADINAVSSSDTALSLAISRGHTDIAEILKQAEVR